MAICECFLCEMWGHGILWCSKSEQSTKVFSANIIFFTNSWKFSPSKVSCYTVYMQYMTICMIFWSTTILRPITHRRYLYLNFHTLWGTYLQLNKSLATSIWLWHISHAHCKPCIVFNPLTTDDECTHHATLAVCYQLAQFILKISFVLAKKIG